MEVTRACTQRIGTDNMESADSEERGGAVTSWSYGASSSQPPVAGLPVAACLDYRTRMQGERRGASAGTIFC